MEILLEPTSNKLMQLPQRSNEDIRLEMAKLIKNNRILLNDNIFPHEEESMELLNDLQTIDEMLKQREKAANLAVQKEQEEQAVQKSDEVIESSVKNLVPIPCEYEVTSDDESECDVSVKDESFPVLITFSNPIFDDNNDFTSSDDELLSDEDVPMEDFKVYSNPLFDDEEINSNKLDPHCFDAESDFIESLSKYDTLFESSLKFDYLEEFSSELMSTSIINEEGIRREHEEYISLMEKLLAINSFPRPLENFHANTIIETLPTSTIPVEDSDSQREEIDIFTGTDDLLPPGIESDDYDSEGDIHFLKELLVNDSISLPKNESSYSDHHDDPSFPRPPSEPPDVEFFFDFKPNSGDLIAVVKNNIDELNEDECFDPGGEINVFSNVEDDDYFSFIFVIRIFLPYLIYPEVSPFLLSAGSEDTIFDPDISLVDKPDEEPAHSEPEPKLVHQGKGDEDDMELSIRKSLETFQAQSQAYVGGVAIREPVTEATRPLPVVEGNGKAIVTEEQVAQSLLALHTHKRRSITDQFILQRRTLTTEEASIGPSTQPLDDMSANIVRDSSSPPNAETGARSDKTRSRGDTEVLQINKELVEDVGKQENIEEKIVELDQGQAGPDPESRGALVGPDPEPTHDEFMADMYPKNLEDAFAIEDQFINDKSTENEPEKPNVEAKVVSMVTVPIYQASFSVPPLSTPIPVIDLSPPKPASSTTQAPVFTATTSTTTTPLPSPPQQHSSTESELAERVAALEKKLSALEQTNKNLNNTTWNLGSRVYTLELRGRSRLMKLSEKNSSQPQAPQSSAWKKSDTRDAPPSSFKQQSDPHAEQPIKDIPIPDYANVSDLEDTDSAYLPKTKQRPECKGTGQALSISKMKVARYLDFGLELLVPEHMLINEDAKGFEFKHDYTIIESPRAVVFPVGNNKQKIMWFNEIYMFSDGTLINIMEALDYRVKEYKVNRLNPGMNTRFWNDKDVERSKKFMHAIE
nr:hypothetical protein [Tanacetum cinerariifolium]